MCHFGTHVTMLKVPRRHEIDKVTSTEAALQSRSWKNIKDYVYNQIQKRKKE